MNSATNICLEQVNAESEAQSDPYSTMNAGSNREAQNPSPQKPRRIRAQHA